MLPELCPEEISAALDQTAEAMLERAGCTAPPVDALALAEALGLQIAFDAGQRERGRLVTLHSSHAAACRWQSGACADRSRSQPGPPLHQCPSRTTTLIILRPDARAERRQWAAAHELGEHAAWEVFHHLGADVRLVVPAWRERVACWLASRLLLPSTWFRHRAESVAWDLWEIKALFATASHELILRRMLDFEAPLVISIYDQGRLALRRSNLPGRVPPAGADDLHCLARVRRSGRPARRGSAACWPVYEPGWQRELVRWEPDPPE